MHARVLRPLRSSAAGRLAGLGATGQRGFSLIVALMMLIVIIILGVSSSQMAINEERAARGGRDRQIAFQAAEAALKDAEFEIYGSTTDCSVPGQIKQGKMRPTTSTCFNEINQQGFAVGCSAPPNAGLCLPGATPAYLDAANVNFYADAKGSGNLHTVAYGTYTGRTYAAQSTVTSLANQPISKYPPRYIIERVWKNTAFESASGDSARMFRVTAMGFGANPNAQVVLQAIVATQY
jgi:type IV pilus assembly protein PilX